MTTKEFTQRLTAFASANSAKASATNRGPVRTIVKNNEITKFSAKAEDPNDIGTTDVTPPSVGFSIGEDGNITTSIEPGKVEYNFYGPADNNNPEPEEEDPTKWVVSNVDYFSMGNETVVSVTWTNSYGNSAGQMSVITSMGLWEASGPGTDRTMYQSWDGGETWDVKSGSWP